MRTNRGEEKEKSGGGGGGGGARGGPRAGGGGGGGAGGGAAARPGDVRGVGVQLEGRVQRRRDGRSGSRGKPFIPIPIALADQSIDNSCALGCDGRCGARWRICRLVATANTPRSYHIREANN